MNHGMKCYINEVLGRVWAVFLLFSFFFLLQSNPCVVTTLNDTYHGLESGDKVVLKELVGMEKLNGSTHTLKEGKQNFFAT